MTFGISESAISVSAKTIALPTGKKPETGRY